MKTASLLYAITLATLLISYPAGAASPDEALELYYACLAQGAIALDDGITSAEAVGKVIHQTRCAKYWETYIRVLMASVPDQYREGSIQNVLMRDLWLPKAIEFVLINRANRSRQSK